MADGILGDLEAGLGKILPYALPAALGASLGGPMGALAGVASAQPDPDEQLKRQKEALDIESEQAGLQQSSQQYSAEQRLLDDPGFHQFFAQQLGIDPAHAPNLKGLGLSGVESLMTNIRQAREAGLKGPIINTPDGWQIKSINGLTPLGGTPENAVISGDKEAGMNQRAANVQAGANQRSQNTQNNANARAAATLAARQQMTPAQKEAALKGYTDSFIKAYGAAPSTDFGGRLTKWRNNYSKYLQDRGVSKTDAEQQASDLAGLKARPTPASLSSSPTFSPVPAHAPSGVMGSDRTVGGKPAFFDPTKKDGKNYWVDD